MSVKFPEAVASQGSAYAAGLVPLPVSLLTPEDRYRSIRRPQVLSAEC
jgi:hypothetical protein